MSDTILVVLAAIAALGLLSAAVRIVAIGADRPHPVLAPGSMVGLLVGAVVGLAVCASLGGAA